MISLQHRLFYTLVLMVLAPHGAAALELKPQVFVEGESITLADLLVPDSISGDVESILKQGILGDAPSEDSEVVLTANQISDVLRNLVRSRAGTNAPSFLDHVQLKIPNEVRVRRAAQTFNETHFKELLLEALRLDCSDCKFEITRVRLPPALPGMEGIPWRLNTQHQRIRGPFSVRVDYREGTRTVGSEYVSGEVRILKSVAVLNKALQLGDRIQPEDFVFKPIDTTFWNDTPLTESELLGARMKRSIRADDPIQRLDIERERLIQKGETVEIHIKENGIDVGMSAIAQDSGQRGDVIRVQNSQTKKQLNGVVIAKGRVELK